VLDAPLALAAGLLAAATPVSGTPPRPVTVTSTLDPGPTLAADAPLPLRVSSNRAGIDGW
jgi:hypothetical protein